MAPVSVTPVSHGDVVAGTGSVLVGKRMEEDRAHFQHRGPSPRCLLPAHTAAEARHVHSHTHYTRNPAGGPAVWVGSAERQAALASGSRTCSVRCPARAEGCGHPKAPQRCQRTRKAILFTKGPTPHLTSTRTRMRDSGCRPEDNGRNTFFVLPSHGFQHCAWALAPGGGTCPCPALSAARS